MFSSFFRRNKKENKTLFEHKLYLAKETPEPIFDLSACDITQVPAGIYALCKVFRKEVLDVSSNQLQSLSGGGKLADLNTIVVLNLSNNFFTVLPFDIQLLHSLKELHLEGNQLKKLPFTICTLGHLELLNVNNNHLHELPEDLGMLFNLKVLLVRNNPKLTRLPRSLHKAHRLCDIQVDSDVVTYPPREVTEQGCEEILKFICHSVDCNCYENRGDVACDVTDTPKNGNEPYHASYTTNIEAKFWDLEKIKEQKQKDFLAIEREWDEIKRQEIEFASNKRINKDKLLAELSYQQEQVNLSLDKIQQVKDAERFKLIEQLKETEYAASHAIQQLLQFNTKPPIKLFELEMQEHEELLRAANEHKEVKNAQILLEMQQILENEANKFTQMDQSRIETTQTILNQEIESNAHVQEILQTIDDRGKQLAVTIQQDEDLQKIAVAALLEKSDVRSWSLVQQVLLVEGQLAALTHIELDRRKLQLDQNLNDLAQQRVELSMVLLELLDQQNARRGELMSTLHDLERINQEKDEGFWMRQYQALLDRMPEGLAEMQKSVNAHFVELLLMEGVLHYLPLLAKLQIDDSTAIDEDTLKSVGITNGIDRQRILDAFDKYRQRDLKKLQEEPSAPASREDLDETASAPVANVGTAEAECVICMDNRCQVVYIPCGHYCCCSACAPTISDCPMCRAKIERIIRVDQ
ncbi:E3 ubiquitin-protein ligase LRSAM1-like isoform X1 [Atheta coriaria]|uniref:E3 ubiquitin-protein ligase LRSAM1-like isoform X1 n=1 Tax=Dalotia coriaria TaxID=877792 RepID=UPI0031F47796